MGPSEQWLIKRSIRRIECDGDLMSNVYGLRTCSAVLACYCYSQIATLSKTSSSELFQYHKTIKTRPFSVMESNNH